MKKQFSLLLTCILCIFPLLSSVSADTFELQQPTQANRVLQSIDYPNAPPNIRREITLLLRNADTKKIIPLSWYTNDGQMFCYAPPNTKLEVIQSEFKPFADVYDESDIQDGKYPLPKPKRYSYDLSYGYLSARGILTGDADGMLRPEDNITRAEAATLLARMLDVSGDSLGVYTDVSKNAWYADAVAGLLDAEVLSGGPRFVPNRLVTREEFTTMLFRAFQWIGAIGDRNSDLSHITDLAQVSPYALPAYRSLPYILHETVEVPAKNGEGGKIPEIEAIYFHPKQSLTRKEAADLLWQSMRSIPMTPTKEAVALGFDKEVPRIDGSTSSYPITEAFFGRMFHNYQGHPSLPVAHSKTIESYKKLIAGDADVILVPDPSEEVKELAKQKGVALRYIPIANEALVFFTGIANTLDTLTIDQLHQIYTSNAYTNWKQLGGPDKELVPYCRNYDSGSHAQMEKFILKGKNIDDQIRKETTSYYMQSILTDVYDYNRTHTDGIAMGYSMYYYYQIAGSVLGVGPDTTKLLKINGIAPTDEAIANGSYPMSTNYFAVVRADTPQDSVTMRFVNWLTTEAGQDTVRNAGFGSIH